MEHSFGSKLKYIYSGHSCLTWIFAGLFLFITDLQISARWRTKTFGHTMLDETGVHAESFLNVQLCAISVCSTTVLSVHLTFVAAVAELFIFAQFLGWTCQLAIFYG